MWLLGWPFYFIGARSRPLFRCARPITLLPYNDSADATIGTKIGIRGFLLGTDGDPSQFAKRRRRL